MLVHGPPYGNEKCTHDYKINIVSVVVQTETTEGTIPPFLVDGRGIYDGLETTRGRRLARGRSLLDGVTVLTCVDWCGNLSAFLAAAMSCCPTESPTGWE